MDAEAMQRQLRSLTRPQAGPSRLFHNVPSTTQAAEAPPPVVLPARSVGCAVTKAVGAAGAHGPHSSYSGPPRAVGRGASRVTRRCLRCACACRRYVIGIQLGSLFLRDTGVDLSTYIICIYLAARCASIIAILGMNSRVLYGHHPGGGTRHKGSVGL